MSDAKQGSAATAKKVPFNQMSRREKFFFICKLTVCILSFGMIYPNLMSD